MMSWGSHIMLLSFMIHHWYFFIYISLTFSKYCWVWVVGLLIYFHFRFPLLIHSWTEIRFYSKLIIWIGKSCLAWFIIFLATWPVLPEEPWPVSQNCVQIGQPAAGGEGGPLSSGWCSAVRRRRLCVRKDTQTARGVKTSFITEA